ncbi:hypothetical protein ARMSODRAFT_27238 [Armillaria solidipes]|uniref:Uncharacterized protein n=1 Tax=Armillaria solidipes TaxID=1076256 RepID=A0A2H3C519_9AGAR|nr:hypothetical protein ARMSODRAFT_27238 [Armillaria solidipes]
MKMRNDVIEVMKLKSYLRFDVNWPLAAYVKGDIINRHIKKGIPRPGAMANTVLQTWTVNVHVLQKKKMEGRGSFILV